MALRPATRDAKMATYRAIVDLYLPGDIYCQAGSLLSDAVPLPAGYLPIPMNWPPPTGGVDCLDGDAQTKLFLQGPRGMSSAEPHLSATANGSRWSNQVVGPPSIFWKAAVGPIGQPGFSLNGVFHDPVAG